MRKSKGQTIDLLYTNKEEKSKKRKSKTNNIGIKKNNNKKKGKIRSNINEKINLDNEMIIGLTPKKETSKKVSNKKSSANSR